MDNCILWKGLTWSQGRYGMDTIDGKSMGAHRAAWIRLHGEIPTGLLVCHKCDNGLCVNPDHLFIGTHIDNMQDCISKGRFSKHDQRGDRNNNSKLTTNDYINIKLDRDNGMTYSQLKQKYNIKSNGHLRNIITFEFS